MNKLAVAETAACCILAIVCWCFVASSAKKLKELKKKATDKIGKVSYTQAESLRRQQNGTILVFLSVFGSVFTVGTFVSLIKAIQG